MAKKCFVLCALFAFLATLAYAASVEFTPPSQKGEIYTVIKYKDLLGIPGKTQVSVKWGTFKKSDTIKPPGFGFKTPTAAGLVLHLKHKKADSVPLSVTTDGTITTAPFQGAPPPEWNNNNFKHVDW